MFPRGPCEAGDIIEERRALLNSQAYYQFSLSPSDTHLHLSLSPHRSLIAFLARLIWPCTPPLPPPLPSTSLPPSQEENKGSKYMLLPPTTHHPTTTTTHPSSSSSGVRSVSLRRVPDPRMSHPLALLPSGLGSAVPILGEFFSSKAQR